MFAFHLNNKYRVVMHTGSKNALIKPVWTDGVKLTIHDAGYYTYFNITKNIVLGYSRKRTIFMSE